MLCLFKNEVRHHLYKFLKDQLQLYMAVFVALWDCTWSRKALTVKINTSERGREWNR
jgi:hypothetical protein